MRASQRGWELLRGLEGQCLYWMSGWWTYKFCYSDVITQFHALPPTPGTAIWPPREDHAAGVFLLGKRATSESLKEKRAAQDLAKFKTNGESKSLVMNYEKGSYCPIIGAERKTEVQFQCAPTVNDRILFVKEVTSCQYLVVIQTARLCHDVAFQEATKGPSSVIECFPVSEESPLPALEATVERTESADEHGTTTELDQQQLEHVELVEELRLDERIDQELAHLSFDKEPPSMSHILREKAQTNTAPKTPGGQRPPAPIADDGKEKLAVAVEMAHGIADQLEDGTLKVSGHSIFDKTNKDVEFQVELQDENGEPMGNVMMKLVDGSVVIELEDELAELATQQEKIKTEEENKKASEQIPEHVRANFERFVGHDEL